MPESFMLLLLSSYNKFLESVAGISIIRHILTCRYRVVPYIEINLSGMEPEVRYNVHLSFVTSDKHPYYYDHKKMEWKIKSNILAELNQLTCHPDSPNFGKFWMRKPASFYHIKLTTNPEMKNSHVRVTVLPFTYY